MAVALLLLVASTCEPISLLSDPESDTGLFREMEAEGKAHRYVTTDPRDRP